MKHALFFLATLLLAPLAALHAADVPQSPTQVWADYDPNKGDFKEEIISEETKDGICNREFYISAYVLGEEIPSCPSESVVKEAILPIKWGCLTGGTRRMV